MSEQQMLEIVDELKENKVLNIEINKSERSATFISRRMQAARLLSERNSANASSRNKSTGEAKDERTGSDLMIMTSDYNYEDDNIKKGIVVSPFNSSDFLRAWNNWKEHRMEKKKPYKSARGEQAGLNQLGQFDEEFSIMLINRSIDSNWQGLVFTETKREYERLRTADERKNGQVTFVPASKRKSSENNIDEELRSRRRL
jgi:hypothetical protein